MAKLIRARCTSCGWTGPNCQEDHAALDGRRCPECGHEVRVRVTARGRAAAALFRLADRADRATTSLSRLALRAAGVRR